MEIEKQLQNGAGSRRYPLLDAIDSLDDFRRVPQDKLPQLAQEIREFLVENVSHTGGHLASSLGAVELTLAMHRVFESPRDKIVFDVGHQAYTHKILTGRRRSFDTLRKKGGISGFPKRGESEHDAFDTGHATTSVSAALGMARAMKLKGEKGVSVALIGDGALTGGMAFEALNDAGESDLPLIVIVNDNDMSIAPNVGMLHQQLINMRMSESYIRFKRFVVRALDTGVFGRWLTRHMHTFKNRVKNFLLPHQLFEEMGFIYFGPIDGHDVDKLIHALRRAKALGAPTIVHCVTQKGRGYTFSESDPEKFHGVSPFDAETGLFSAASKKTNSQVFGETMIRLAASDERIVAITAAMPSGTGLTTFAKQYPNRFFDVGIAEEHAVTMAAGMATQGMRPVVAIYSTFLQRAFDQTLHDVCLMKLPVVLAVDRAGLVGEDGTTHQGMYDAAYLSLLPGMTIYSPATQQELAAMIALAIDRGEPAAVRYNRGRLMQAVSSVLVERGKWEKLLPLAECTIIATGCMVAIALPVAKECGAGLINARTIKPLDDALLDEIGCFSRRVIVMEDGVDCLGAAVALRLVGCEVVRMHAPDRPVAHASIAQQREECGLTEEALRRVIGEKV